MNNFKYNVWCIDGKISVRINLFFITFFFQISIYSATGLVILFYFILRTLADKESSQYPIHVNWPYKKKLEIFISDMPTSTLQRCSMTSFAHLHELPLFVNHQFSEPCGDGVVDMKNVCSTHNFLKQKPDNHPTSRSCN